MKLSLILIAALALVACADGPEDNQAPQVKVDEHIPSPGGGGGYYNPCGRVYVLEIKTDAGTFRKEVPIYCNPYAEEPYGDPPDWKANAVDTDPVINPVLPSQNDKF